MSRPAICSIDKCDRPHAARTFCDKHYREKKRLGEPMPESVYKYRPIVEKDDYLLLPIGLNAKHGYAKVDKLDRDKIEGKMWTLCKGYPLTNRGSYRIHLHHLIIGHPPKNKVVDHINRDRLDNRRENLRFVSQHINSLNTGMFSHNTSGHRGVVWDASRNKWVARAKIAGKEVHLGRFENKEDAIKRREEFWNEYVKTVQVPRRVP